MTCASAVTIATLVPGLQRAGDNRPRCAALLDDFGAARIDDDQFRALTQTLLHARGEHRMGVGRDWRR